jgi:hypothetical protein
VRAKAIMRSAFVALVSLMFSEKNVDVECVHVLCLITRDVLLSCSKSICYLHSRKAIVGARRVHYILLDIADALCEAKCAGQGDNAKCIRRFGLVDVFREGCRCCQCTYANRACLRE